MLYRIYTQDWKRHAVERMTGNYFDGATFIEARGMWKGDFEASLIIEIIDPCPDGTTFVEGKVQDLARDIKLLNDQETVMVTRTPITTVFI